MPLYDYLCLECKKLSEILVTISTEKPQCSNCGSPNLKKMLSAPSSLSGSSAQKMPGPGDTACCGSSPMQAQCAGPGSCCGRVPT